GILMMPTQTGWSKRPWRITGRNEKIGMPFQKPGLTPSSYVCLGLIHDMRFYCRRLERDYRMWKRQRSRSNPKLQLRHHKRAAPGGSRFFREKVARLERAPQQ